jgi:dTDP-4-dehydrorhamnose reductase
MHAPPRSVFDLALSRGIAPFIDRIRPDLIVNCAAYTAVDEAERNRDRAEQINSVAPGVIAHAARAVGAGMIHFSTDYVFDGKAQRPYRETDACAPLNVYGQTKLHGEEQVAAAGGGYLIVRTSWIYAPIGRNFLRTILRLGAERRCIDVVDDQVGAPTSAMTIAEHVAAIVAQIVGPPRDYLGRFAGIVHVACAGQTTWHGFATAIFEEARMRKTKLAVRVVTPIATEQYPTPARRPAYSVLDLTKLTQVFGVKPVPWRQALSKVMDSFACSQTG